MADVTQIASSVLDLGLGKPIDSRMDEGTLLLKNDLRIGQRLFASQTAATQTMLLRQAHDIADTVFLHQRSLRFELPEQIVFFDADGAGDIAWTIPATFRRQTILAPLPWKRATGMRAALRRRLAQLEQSPYPGVHASGRLIRFAVARYLVCDYSPPQPRLNGTASTAETQIRTLQNQLAALDLAISLAPYFFLDEIYRTKRADLLHRLISEGYALANLQVRQMIEKLHSWSAAHQLDRGLRLRVPYFDLATLGLALRSFDVIPAGRTSFVPAFLVLAVARERDRVEEDAGLSTPTRVHLLELLSQIEQSFLPAEEDAGVEKGTL
jgi:hypothetical protein